MGAELLWTYNSWITTINPSVWDAALSGSPPAHSSLVRWGNSGWELVSVVPTGRPNEFVFFFKRPMQPGEYIYLGA